ncbi:MAG: VCBS repeat-containing protein [Deltaproteobacteria bacterium]|nr:VCBS repeat-containing protein [Deltaproteobacteria bacterium]
MLPWAAWAANPLPLSQIPVPEPPNLAEFVKNKAAAIRLGKALFWDMQVGSDGIMACASCHYKAGADPLNVRAKNQLHPGPDGTFQVLAGPNQTLTAAHFPFHQVSPVDAQLGTGTITNDKNDVVGSQGVELQLFQTINVGSPLDTGNPFLDPIFQHFRQVTGRNTPPAVNAVFNFANFWDGRAHYTFNGASPIGPLDTTAGVWVNVGIPSSPILGKVKVSIPNASLASQATGPPLSSVEMSWAGRTWPQLGRKMLSLAPLAQQLVSPTDSVLGSLSKSPANGINTTYLQMIMDAFQPKYWSVAQFTPDGFSQVEANFSLFWGLAVQLYEATLVSDQTPFDKWLEAGAPGDGGGLISQAAVRGFGIFQSKCAGCHAGSEFSDATLNQAFIEGLILVGETNTAGAISDSGFHNIGVRPTADDIGRGGVINFNLSFSRQAIDRANGTLPFAPLQPLPDGVTVNTPVAVNGAFKTPMLRNVALTAPYMHNGSMATLAEVVEFYARHGNFDNPELATEMNLGGTLRGAPDKRAEVVAFLESLTDPRVANDTAPFDHPELRIPAGGAAVDGLIVLPATGAGGTAATPHAADTRTFFGLTKVVKNDFDLDGRTDIAVWRGGDGTWYIVNSADNSVTVTQWGAEGDKAVSGDFDGDGITDIAVYRPSNGNWYIINSATGTVTVTQWGAAGDIPVPGDYDLDGKTDIAVYRPSDGNWYIINSATGTVTVTQWGAAGDLPVQGDYDLDGKTDIAVWRPASGTWFIVNSQTGSVTTRQWGMVGDLPVPGDYDGDGKTDMAVWRSSNGNWYIINSASGAVTVTQWGTLGDSPIGRN